MQKTIPNKQLHQRRNGKFTLPFIETHSLCNFFSRDKITSSFLSTNRAILLLLLLIGSSTFLSADSLVKLKKNETIQLTQEDPINDFLQKIDIYPTSELISKDGKIILQLKENVLTQVHALVIEYGFEFERQSNIFPIINGQVVINNLGYNSYDLHFLDKNNKPLAKSNFTLPLPSSHAVFEGQTNYFKPYQQHLASGKLVVHNYTERSARAQSRSSQTCNYQGYTLDRGYWYKISNDNATLGGGGRFVYISSSCGVSSPYGLNCAQSPGGAGRNYNISNPTQWVERDAITTFGLTTTRKLGYIYANMGGLGNAAEDLMQCVISGAQCNDAGRLNEVSTRYKEVMIDANLTVTTDVNGEIEISTNADHIRIFETEGLSVCGGNSATLSGNVLSIAGSGQRTVTLCSDIDRQYNFCTHSISSNDLLYIVSHNMVRQYFFGLRNPYLRNLCVGVTNSTACNLSITSQPENPAACEGERGTFCVTATGSGLSYQWQYSSDGTNLGGNASESTATTRCLETGNDFFYFRVRVRDANGCEEFSDWARLTRANPSITSQPENPTACEGERGTFCVTATGSGLSYQWQYSSDGTNLGGNASESTATTRCLETSNDWLYFRVRVRDVNGCEEFSDWARLTRANPSITSQPENPTACEGERGSFCVTATGSGLSYQWQYSSDGINVGGNASEVTATTRCLETSNDFLYFRVRVRDANGCEEFSDWVKLVRGGSCPEVCDNSLDDDGDGAIDCADSDCSPNISSINRSSPSNCPDLNNGQITISATGANLRYSISNGSSYQSSSTFTGLSAGNYTIRVRNINTGCFVNHSSNTSLTDPSCSENCTNGIDDDGDGQVDCADNDCNAPSINGVSESHPDNCPNIDNGQITISATGSSLRYSINNGNSYQSSNIFTGLGPGNYTIRVRNNSTGCEITHSNTITLIDPNCAEICDNGIDDDGDNYIDSQDPDCPCTGMNGYAVNQTNTGTANPSNALNSPDDNYADLRSGDVLTLDLNSIIPAGEVLTIYLARGNDNGRVTIEGALNVSGSYSGAVVWGNPSNATTTLPATQTAGVFEAISYTIPTGGLQYLRFTRNAGQVRVDALGYCFVVEICDNGIDDDGDGQVDCDDGDCGSPIINGVSETNPSNCPDLNNGQITITATGSDLDYSINGGSTYQSSTIFTGLSASTYNIRVRNSITGCVVAHTAAITLTASSCSEICDNGLDDDGDGQIDCDDGDCGSPVITSITPSNPTCSSFDDGSITVNATGANLAYSINSGSYQTSNIFNDLMAGNYTIRIRNSVTDCFIDHNELINLTNPNCIEICDNGIDDDGDGLIDCLDPDCLYSVGVLARNDSLNACPGMVLEGNVAINDQMNRQNTNFNLLRLPIQGSVIIDNNGSFEYTPNSFDCTVDEFTYRACNTISGCCDTALVYLELTDTTKPDLYNVPADVTISCDEQIPTTPLVSAFDNCPRIAIDVTEMSTQGEDGCSLYDYTITRTWEVTDVCGNTNSDSQIVDIQDITAPDIYRIYTLPNGKKMVAGVMENVNQNWKTISLPIDFPTTPLVFTQVVSTNDNAAVTTRIRNVSTAQFDLKLQEEDGADNNHIRENVAWIAIETGNQNTGFPLEARTVTLADAWQTINFQESYTSLPSFFATMQTINDPDPSSIRFDNPSFNSIDIQVEEETSIDANISHSTEQVAFLGIEHGIDLVNDKGHIFGETGSISVDERWKTITTQHQYYNPVVIAGIPQNNESDPGVVRIRNVSPNSFEIRFEEWNYLDNNHAFEFIPYLIMEGSLPLDASILCDEGIDSLEIGKDILAVDNCDINVALQYEQTEFVDGNARNFVRTWYAVDECGNATGLSQIVPCTGVGLQLKAFLQGAMLHNDEANNLMRDDLRRKGLLPIKEPYTSMLSFDHIGAGGEEECLPEMLQITGEKAIVDWVFIELKDADNPDQVMATCAALLQRNGDIITAQGDSIIYFNNLPPSNYYVSLRHRNHLKVETMHPYLFNETNIPYIDFSYNFLPTLGQEAFAESDQGNTLWSGDLNQDEKTIYQGPNNDVFPMFLQIILDDANQAFLPNFINRGYTKNDFNMDGLTIYQGPNNDRANLLFNTILKHPTNKNKASNYILSTADKIAADNFEDCLIDKTLLGCDFDGDGKLNKTDSDDDNDGVIDGNDIAPYNPQSDSDGDGIMDKIESQNGTNPLNACDPYQDHSSCRIKDYDGDGKYKNYPKNHSLYDPNDFDACIPNPYALNCGCPDEDSDGFIFVCHTTESGQKQTLKITLEQWRLRQAVGDFCGKCQ